MVFVWVVVMVICLLVCVVVCYRMCHLFRSIDLHLPLNSYRFLLPIYMHMIFLLFFLYFSSFALIIFPCFPYIISKSFHLLSFSVAYEIPKEVLVKHPNKHPQKYVNYLLNMKVKI